MNSEYLSLLYKRDKLVAQIIDIDIALKRMQYLTCNSFHNIDREIDTVYSVLDEMLREKNYEIDKLFIANDAKS